MTLPFSVILLAGGIGSRMGAALPKQYLPLQDKPLALYSFELFLSFSEMEQIVVVCEAQYEELFASPDDRLTFARPGKRRQDSVYHGLQQIRSPHLVCVHDSARPFIDSGLVRRLLQAAHQWQAAVAGVPVKGTIKRCNLEGMVLETPDRAALWEVQTPQVIHFDLLHEGFALAQAGNLTVTDDVSLVELLGRPVKVVEGNYKNIKITTPEDLILAEQLIKDYALL